MSVKRPDPTDRVIGERIKGLRLQRGLSQTTLAESIGVTFQQVQKYEKGVNRVSGGRLVRIAALLGVTVADFLDKIGEPAKNRATGGEPDPFHLLSQNREGLRLARAFIGISQKKSRAAILQVAEAFALDERRKAR